MSARSFSRLLADEEVDYARALKRGFSNLFPSPTPTPRTLPRLAKKCSVLDWIDDIAKHDCSGAYAKSVLRFDSLIDCLPASDSDPAIASADGRYMTHGRLRSFVLHEFDLAQFGLTRNDRVGVVLPQGPDLAVCLLATCCYCTCAPVNISNTPDEILSDLLKIKAKAVIIPSRPPPDTPSLASSSPTLKHDALRDTLATSRLTVLSLVPRDSDSVCGAFDLVHESGPGLPLRPAKRDPNGRTDVALVLQTSGTVGTKKTVPYTLENLVVGASCIIASWRLRPTDVNLNMMPLFHVGGIMRNLLGPVLSGGSTVTCAGFDAAAFWDIVSRANPTAPDARDSPPTPSTPRVLSPTWYYAAPTMHQMILREGRDGAGRDVATTSIHMICNAAGGLLPSLATELRDRFNATVLPSYGMTECMPISSPPASYTLDRPGTSGKSVGPELAILDDAGKRMPPGSIGNIAVRGPPLMPGYEDNPEANAQAFFPNGFFNTGDLGYLDEDRYLFVTGRSKEVINRGGEIISPFEVEEALQSLADPRMRQCLAFSVEHDVLQEAVGLVIVPEPAAPRVDLAVLHSLVTKSLHPSKWPITIVFMTDLPRNAANKVLRAGLAKRMALPVFSDSTPPLSRLFEAQCPPKGAPLSSPIPTAPVRVDLEEVAALIRQYPGVTAAAAFLVPRDVMVCVTPSSVDVPGLETHLAHHLHHYLRPRRIAPMDTIPTLPDGSIDTHVFAARAQGATHLGQEAVPTPPSNEIESAVLTIFKEVLEVPAEEAVGVDMDFFAYGGSSLRVGPVLSRVRKLLSVTLPLGSLYSHRTVAELALEIARRRKPRRAGPHGPNGHLDHSQSQNRVRELERDSLESRDKDNERDSDPYSGLKPDPYSDLERPVSRSACFKADDAVILIGPGSKNRSENGGTSTPAPGSRPAATWNLGADLSQLVPLALLYPLSRMLRWWFFAAVLFSLCQYVVTMNDVATHVRMLHLLLAFFIAHVTTTGIVLPILGILIKWLLIGKYKSGRYALWGSYYIRWWLVKSSLAVCGRGVFLSSSSSLRLYYRLLGAHIGRGVLLHHRTNISEFDLVYIGDGSAIDQALVRPFSLHDGEMVLRAIRIGRTCSVGPKTDIAPGAILPDNTCLGPLSSSYEIHDASPTQRAFCRPLFPGPGMALKLFAGVPILVLGQVVKSIPWLACVVGLLSGASYLRIDSTMSDILNWFIDPSRVGFYFVSHVARETVSPILYVAYCVVTKRLLLGRFTTGPRDRSQWNLFRHWLMASLLPGGDLGGLAPLIGTHYEAVSVVYRLLGAKVGKRVYWPGSGLDVVEFDMLDIGDDVVFGSRSVIMCSDMAEVLPVRIEPGAMVADRCVILPGVTIGRNALLGSGSIAAKRSVYPAGSTWVGSKNGSPVPLNMSPPNITSRVSHGPISFKPQYQHGPFESDGTMKSFGRALYERKANYWVIPVWLLVPLNFVTSVFCSAYWTSLVPASLYGSVFFQRAVLGKESSYNMAEVAGVMYATLIVTVVVASLLALSIDVAAKWILLGRRQPGVYEWDKSSYCQRWQLYLLAQRIRIKCLSGLGVLEYITGSRYLVWYFRSLGCHIGRDVCLYPNGADPMMTEPDLVWIEDRACVDDASLVAHMNAHGKFTLSRLHVGPRAVLRSGSRLLAGASMEAKSTLLEHTLLVSGEVADQGTVWQGWPASMVLQHLSAKSPSRLGGPGLGNGLIDPIPKASPGAPNGNCDVTHDLMNGSATNSVATNVVAGSGKASNGSAADSDLRLELDKIVGRMNGDVTPLNHVTPLHHVTLPNHYKQADVIERVPNGTGPTDPHPTAYPLPASLDLRLVKPDRRPAKPDPRTAKPDLQPAKPDPRTVKPDPRTAKPALAVTANPPDWYSVALSFNKDP